jgi:importin subunit alpha-1
MEGGGDRQECFILRGRKKERCVDGDRQGSLKFVKRLFFSSPLSSPSCLLALLCSDMESFDKNHQPRRTALKKGLDATESRHKRQDMTVQLRTEKREEQTQKRRREMQQQLQQPKQDVAAEDMQLREMGLPNAEEIARSLDQHLPRLIQLLMNTATPPPHLMAAVRALRQLTMLLQGAKLTALLRVDERLLVRLCELLAQTLTLNEPPTDAQIDLVWALTNISGGSSGETLQVVQAGALPLLAHIIKRSPYAPLRDQAMWALGNIAGDSARMRDSVLAQDILMPIIEICRVLFAATSSNTDQQQLPPLAYTIKDAVGYLHNASWTLSNLMRGKPLVVLSREHTVCVLQVLRTLLAHTNEEVVENVNWALSYMSDNADSERMDLFIEMNMVTTLVPFLTHYTKNVKMAALRTIGNLASGNERVTQAVIDAHVLPVLRALLVSQYQSLRKETAWVISNIAAGNIAQVGAVLNANLIAPLVQMLSKEPFVVQKEVTWVFCNIVLGGTSEQVSHVMRHGVIAPLCQMLECPDTDLLVTILEAMARMLQVGAEHADAITGVNPVETAIEEGDGLRLLERLPSHENSGVYRAAEKILKHYFAADEEEEQDSSVANESASNQVPTFRFG